MDLETLGSPWPNALLSLLLERNCYLSIIATIIINLQFELNQVSTNVLAGSKSTPGHRKFISSLAKFACDAISMPNANESSVKVEVSGFWVQ